MKRAELGQLLAQAARVTHHRDYVIVHRETGINADPVSPALPSLPDGWEARPITLPLVGGAVAWCLEPHDAAVEPGEIERARRALADDARMARKPRKP